MDMQRSVMVEPGVLKVDSIRKICGHLHLRKTPTPGLKTALPGCIGSSIREITLE